MIILQILTFLLVLGVVVTVHELGHYWAGRLFGAAAESFSVGFGKSIVEKTDRRGTRWRINRFPIGGFVKFVGESQMPKDVGQVEQGPVGKPYNALTPLQRIIVSLAGPFANFVLAVFLFAAIAVAFGKPVVDITITEVNEGTPAASAGLQPGDVVRTLDGKPVDDINDFLVPIALGTGKTLTVMVDRDGRDLVLPVTPERADATNSLGQPVKIGRIGAGISQRLVDVRRFNVLTALPEGVSETASTISMSADMLARLVTGKEPISNLKGPVGIADTTRRAIDVNMEVENASLGQRLNGAFWTIIQLTALISVGIGLVNLLPLPILDGGHVVFNTWELLSGRAVPEKVQEVSLTFGLIMLFGVAAIVTFHDIVGTGILKVVGAG